ncbi:MAG: acetylxylan esterase [Planctomycetota bacterium]
MIRLANPKFVLLLLWVFANSAIDSKTMADDKESPLYRHLQAQAVAILKNRSEARLQLKSAADVAQISSSVREKLKQSLGPWLEKTPLNAQVTGSVQGAGLKVEKIVFQSRPGHHVTACLYLPSTPPPWPGVIVPCGHSANGKAAETYQRASILLAKSGMAALCYDPIGQGERVQALKPDQKPLFSGSTTEHTRMANGSLLVGLQTAHYRVWDGIRALDYLESRPDIDKNRLGCTGNSGGGTLTSYLMAVDDRIYAAAASCYLTNYERLLDTIGPQDAEQNITGLIADGMDHGDFLLARLPKPTLMCVATRDFFDITGAWQTFREAKKLFGAAGFGERVDLFEFDDGHGFSSPRRVASTRWLSRWLLEKNAPITEPDFPIFTDAQLQVTQSGQVLNLPEESSVFQINGIKAQKLTENRVEKTRSQLNSNIRQRLHLPDLIVPASSSNSLLMEGQILKSIYKTGDGFELHALKCRIRDQALLEWKSDTSEMPTTLIVGAELLPDHRKSGDINSILNRLKTEKIPIPDGTLILLDLRGSAPNGKKSADPNGADWREASLALLLNQNLVGLRTSDLLSVLITESRTSRNIAVIALGRSAIPAIHASVLAPEIARYHEVNATESWLLESGKPDSRLHLADIVPGVLADYDLPDLRAAIRKP